MLIWVMNVQVKATQLEENKMIENREILQLNFNLE